MCSLPSSSGVCCWSRQAICRRHSLFVLLQPPPIRLGQLEHIERARETLLALLRPTQQRSHIAFELACRAHVHGLHRRCPSCRRLRIGGLAALARSSGWLPVIGWASLGRPRFLLLRRIKPAVA